MTHGGKKQGGKQGRKQGCSKGGKHGGKQSGKQGGNREGNREGNRKGTREETREGHSEGNRYGEQEWKQGDADVARVRGLDEFLASLGKHVRTKRSVNPFRHVAELASEKADELDAEIAAS